MENQDNHSYDDIINLPNPTSTKHPRMPLSDRAAQFSPFAALTGHEAAIKETARRTDEKLMLSDEVIAELNEKLKLIAEPLVHNKWSESHILYRIIKKLGEHIFLTLVM